MKGDSILVVGDWHIVENVYGTVYASHMTCSAASERGLEGHRDSWLLRESPKCWYCMIKVPDEVQALMILRLDGI